MARQKIDEKIVTELAVAVGSLVRRVRAVIPADAQELTWPQMAVLKRLSDGGAPMTTAELARAENVRPQSMGATIAEMEEQKLVRRKAHPTDGRQMLVELTAKGETLFQEGRTARRAWMLDAIHKLEPKQQQEIPALIALLQKLAEM